MRRRRRKYGLSGTDTQHIATAEKLVHELEYSEVQRSCREWKFVLGKLRAHVDSVVDKISKRGLETDYQRVASWVDRVPCDVKEVRR
jgi:hypothetical protein